LVAGFAEKIFRAFINHFDLTQEQKDKLSKSYGEGFKSAADKLKNEDPGKDYCEKLIPLITIAVGEMQLLITHMK
jgi:hypothetical protein